jgi:hypothetical protein
MNVMTSKIDSFEITDTATDRFPLSRPPVPGSLIVSLNGLAQGEGSDFALEGQDLVILNPGDLFRGVETQDPPWDLQVQYDY